MGSPEEVEKMYLDNQMEIFDKTGLAVNLADRKHYESKTNLKCIFWISAKKN